MSQGTKGRNSKALRVTLALAAATMAATVAAESLGRLFFTAEQRAAMDHPGATAQAPRASAHRVDGIVQPAVGQPTIWIDGTARHGDSHLERAPGDSPRATLRESDGKTWTLHVGESIDDATHAIDNGLNGGSISIDRAPR